MFFQGSDSIELLTASGKDPAAHWKTLGKVRREFDKASKAYLMVLDGPAAATKLSLPKDTKPLGLTHRYVVLQAWLPSGKAISLELGVTDVAGNRRRLLLSTAFRDCAVHQLHAQIPFQQLRRETWMHWTFDVARLVASGFPSQALRTLDSIVLCGSWKLRRIFTMKDPPMSAAAAFASGLCPYTHDALTQWLCR
ncbi:hypothetical protein SPRG_07993 [Saprolegnia parasitica CBS 223.65]|uniref:CFA20 domain-containing protein n=1 Tax=Saprolegnia parasitica (strain CBS 223.65) TaxID=695850 RepID=A0A067C745_SAPPC|nr:hypothetical protein SPRG_07993 [Saprolegnia parasitica CBS 223.65]KDO26589.1 hypothetical protein SPRG_07993 [Saprolegnia parasitica CBS 223.65]|eukprot:XP_012202731.1 hypothetical protein SPRG_07993 [Saprolegnia parasitica CBS 223.65]